MQTDVLPLAVKFQCCHCPKGVFGVLVTHLMAPEPSKQNRSITFTLIQDKIFKDQVSFEVITSGFHDEMSIKVYSSHLDVNFFPGFSKNRELPTEVVCCNTRVIIEESIIKSLRNLHYSKERVQPEMCFKCGYCSEFHPITKGKDFYRIYCNTTKINSRLPPHGRCWYGEGKLIATIPACGASLHCLIITLCVHAQIGG